MAYEIAPEDCQAVTEHLDFREKCGYCTAEVSFHPEDSDIGAFPLTIYIATEGNPHYAGPAELGDIALQISNSEGPSGHNTEYLFELAEAVRETMPHVQDSHLFELEREVKKISQNSPSSRDIR